ncbi:MAG TPA: AMP-binding protein [Candidatus Thalassarchaeaceae archaeon]|nr:AMP-binding protein [Candidatus Thalassarchaeaceae archaeon]
MSGDKKPMNLPVNEPGRNWDGPSGDDPITLHDLLTKSVERHSQLLAFGHIHTPNAPRIHISYGEFGELVDCCAKSLRDMGLNKGDRVAMILDNSVEWAATSYATNSLGAAYTAMYTHQHGSEWSYIIGDSKPSVLIAADTDVLDKLCEHLEDDNWPAFGIILLGDESPNANPPEGVAVQNWSDFVSSGRNSEPLGEPARDHSALATLIYTSGTTGNPKGVMLSNWNILHNILAMQGRFDIYEGDRTASFLPWAHSFGQMGDLHFMIHSGIHINLISDVLKIADECQEIKPHALFAVPRVWNKLYGKVMEGLNSSPIKKRLGAMAFKKAKARCAAVGVDCVAVKPKGFLDKKLDKIVMGKVRGRFGGKLRFCVSGGAALDAEIASFIQCVGFDVFEGYGLTETSPLISLNGWESDKRCMIGTVGRPVPGVRVHIDEDAWDDPNSSDGEIIAYGPNIMQGYWNKEEATAEVMTDDGGFRTGDLGRLDDGFLRITGRVKEQFKLENGKYVAPSPLEESLKLSPIVEQCCVDGRNKIKTFTIIHPNEKALRSGLSSAGINNDGSLQEICESPEVRSWVLKNLKGDVMATPNWKGFEISGSIILDHEEWTTDNGLITPKLSVRRNRLLDRHQDDIDSLK